MSVYQWPKANSHRKLKDSILSLRHTEEFSEALGPELLVQSETVAECLH